MGGRPAAEAPAAPPPPAPVPIPNGRRRGAAAAAGGAASVLLYSTVLEPQPATVLTKEAKEQVLRISTAWQEARYGPLRQEQRLRSALDAGANDALIDVRLRLDDGGGSGEGQQAGAAAAAAPAAEGPGSGGGSRKRRRSSGGGAPRFEQRVAALLDEVHTKLPLQHRHEEELDAAATAAAARVAGGAEDGGAGGRRPRREATASCSACMDVMPLSALVTCPFFQMMANGHNQGARGFARRKQAAAHILCAPCLRIYLTSVRLHGGDLGKVVCPGCVASIRLLVGPEHAGQSLQSLMRKDWVEAEGPYPRKTVMAVLGPVDLLRLTDLRERLRAPPALDPNTEQYLRASGARQCPRCQTPHVKGAGCDAVMCELCTVIFDYQKAPLV